MLTISINDQALAQVRASLEEIYGRLDDFTPAMVDIGQELEGRVRDRFRTRTDPLGNPWAPWAESTQKYYPYPGSEAAKRAKEGAGRVRVLERYGPMIDHLTWQADKTSVRIGFAQPYATHHEYGTRKMPRRGMLYASPEDHQLSDPDQRYILDAIERYLLTR